MNILYPTGIKFVAAGGAIAATALRTLPQGVPLKHNIERKIIEHILSDNPNPDEIYALQPSHLVDFSFSDAEYTDLPILLGGGTATGDVFTLTQTVNNLALYDLRIQAMRVNGTIVFIDLTNMFFIPKLDAQFVDNGELFIPAQMKGSRTSVLTWDISPA